MAFLPPFKGASFMEMPTGLCDRLWNPNFDVLNLNREVFQVITSSQEVSALKSLRPHPNPVCARRIYKPFLIIGFGMLSCTIKCVKE